MDRRVEVWMNKRVGTGRKWMDGLMDNNSVNGWMLLLLFIFNFNMDGGNLTNF